MRHRPLLTISLAVLAGAVGTMFLEAADPPVDRPLDRPVDRPADTILETTVLMRAKLSSSQKVLEGLLSEDYTLIAQGAREMRRVSEAAEWPRVRDAVYEHHAAEFRRLCIKLESLAAKTNHEGASFTYLQMTTTCITCHNHVRDALRIAEAPNGGVQLIPTIVPEH